MPAVVPESLVAGGGNSNKGGGGGGEGPARRRAAFESQPSSYEVTKTATDTHLYEAGSDEEDSKYHGDDVPFAVKFGYGLPQFSMLSLTLVISIYGNTYYEMMGAPLAHIAFFTALARSFDVMTDPLMGWVSDNTRSRFGRRRPYIIGGMWFFSLAFVGLMAPPAAPETRFGLSTSYWFAIFYIAFYFGDTVANVPYSALGPELTTDTDVRTQIFFYAKLYSGIGTLIGATSPEIVKQVLLSQGRPDNRDTISLSFFLVGCVFGGMYLLLMLFVIFNVSERMESQEASQIPLVPAVLRSFKNRAFRPLLMGWILDAIALASLAAMFPFFIIYVIQPDSKAHIGSLTIKLTAGTTQALCFAALFVSALIAMPLWKLLARYMGKYYTWLAYNLLNSLTNFLYAFVGAGDPKTTIAITALNGIPVGAQFLIDSILADVIDYDEFLNGTRNEGGFTVFATFIPKFVSVPASALPLSVIAMIGFVPSDADGNPSPQPPAVRNFIRFVFVIVPCFCTLTAFFAKRYFPIRNRDTVDKITQGIASHKQRLAAFDPITGKKVSLLYLSDEDQAIAFSLDHFSQAQLAEVEATGGNAALVRTMQIQLAGMVCMSAVLGAVVGLTFGYLDDPAVSIVPIVSVVGCGVSVCMVCLASLRLIAAYRLHVDEIPDGLLRTIIRQKSHGARGGDEADDAEAFIRLRKNYEAMTKYTDTLESEVASLRTQIESMGVQPAVAPTPKPVLLVGVIEPMSMSLSVRTDSALGDSDDDTSDDYFSGGGAFAAGEGRGRAAQMRKLRAASHVFGGENGGSVSDMQELQQQQQQQQRQGGAGGVGDGSGRRRSHSRSRSRSQDRGGVSGGGVSNNGRTLSNLSSRTGMVGGGGVGGSGVGGGELSPDVGGRNGRRRRRSSSEAGGALHPGGSGGNRSANGGSPTGAEPTLKKQDSNFFPSPQMTASGSLVFHPPKGGAGGAGAKANSPPSGGAALGSPVAGKKKTKRRRRSTSGGPSARGDAVATEEPDEFFM